MTYINIFNTINLVELKVKDFNKGLIEVLDLKNNCQKRILIKKMKSLNLNKLFHFIP